MKHLPLKIQESEDYNVGVSGWVLLFASSQEYGNGNKDKKGESNMRKYKSNGQLETVLCNQCGKKLVVEKGIVREGVIAIDHVWDFFSEKDGEIHHFDLCEECYDELLSQFRIPVGIEEQVELL